MSNYVSLNIRMFASKPDKTMERVILNLNWDTYAAAKATEYARKVLKSRWIAGERKIKKSPYYCYAYARHVIGGRWKEAENNIAKDDSASYLYAKYVIKDRFKEAEKSFKSPREIYLYSKYVLKSRWEEKEQAIEKYLDKHPMWCMDAVINYCVHMRKQRWENIEEFVVKSRHIEKYHNSLKTEKDKEEFYNKILAESLCNETYWNYATDFIKKIKSTTL